MHYALDHSAFGYSNGFSGYGAGDLRSFRDLDHAAGNNVTLYLPGNDHVARFDGSGPNPVFRESNCTLQIAITVNFAADLKVAVAGNETGNLAAFADKGGRPS